MKKKLFSLFLVTVLTLSAAVPAFAGTTSGSTDVSIETVATTIDITVPDTLPIVFNADGTTTVPTNWTIENDTPLGGIYIVSIAMTAKDESAAGWKLLPQSADVSNLAANTKQLKFSIGKAGELKCIAPAGNDPAATGSFEFAPEDIQISAGGSQVLAMEVERGAFTTGEGASSAFTMEIEFAFDGVADVEMMTINLSLNKGASQEYTVPVGSTWKDLIDTYFEPDVFSSQEIVSYDSSQDDSPLLFGNMEVRNYESHATMVMYINDELPAETPTKNTHLIDGAYYRIEMYIDPNGF